MTKYFVRFFLSLVLRSLAVVLLTVPAAMAQSAAGYPDRPIKLLVPFAPGGLVDTYARSLHPRLVELLGQQVIIENRGGAGGTIAEAMLAKATPDGYTIMMSGDSVPANPHLYKGLSYELFRDLTPVSQLARVPLVLVSPTNIAPESLRDFVAWGKQRAGQISFASPGTGTSNHFASELFNAAAGLRMVHVPYKGGGPAMTDLMGGQVQALFSSVFVAAPQVKAGKIRALAVSSERRSALLPQVPTFAEAGYPGFVMASWSGLFVPAGTPPAIIQRLHGDFAKALRAPDVQARLAELATEAVAMPPAEFAAVLRAEYDKFGKLIRELGISVN